MVETLELNEHESTCENTNEFPEKGPRETVTGKISNGYWNYVLNVNTQCPEKIRENRNGRLCSIKKLDYLKSEMNRKIEKPFGRSSANDEVDGIFPEPGHVRDEFYGKENYRNVYIIHDEPVRSLIM